MLPLCMARHIAGPWIKNGARYICATGMDTHMLVNCIGRIDVDKVIELGEYFKKKLEEADDIRVTSKNGTDLRARWEGVKFVTQVLRRLEKDILSCSPVRPAVSH